MEIGKIMATDKKELRKSALVWRQSMPEVQRTQKMRKILVNLSRLSIFQKAQAVMVYAATNGEVDVWPWVERLLSQGVAVAYPLPDPDSKRMDPKLIRSHGDLKPGHWGILQPDKSAPSLSLDRLDGVIVPALAFDRRGFRVGYGGGYYDRFLPRLHPRTATVGLVYHELLLDQVPRSDHDVAVHWVVTDHEVIHTPSRGSGR